MHPIYYELVIRYAYSNCDKPEEEMVADIELLGKLEESLLARERRASGSRHNYDVDVYLCFSQLRNKLYDAISQALYDCHREDLSPGMARTLDQLRSRLLQLRDKDELDLWVEEAWDALKHLGLQ